MYCKDCKFWVENEYSPKPKDDYPMKGCSNNENFHIGYSYPGKAIQESGAWIEGDEGWGWITAPAFGCIHFKKRVAEKSV